MTTKNDNPSDAVVEVSVDGREATQRRVYVLPLGLVDRIVAYQRSKNLSSEVEAVRQLLDDALKFKETPHDIAYQVSVSLSRTKNPMITVRDVLFGHPLVRSLSFVERGVEFQLADGSKYLAKDDADLYEWHSPTKEWQEWMPF